MKYAEGRRWEYLAPQNQTFRVDRARQAGKVAYLGEGKLLFKTSAALLTCSIEGLEELILNVNPGDGVTRKKTPLLPCRPVEEDQRLSPPLITVVDVREGIRP